MKTRIGSVDDPLEREADRAADAVIAGRAAGPITTGQTSGVRPKCAECQAEDEEELRRKCGGSSGSVHSERRAAGAAARSIAQGGIPLTARQRAYFEPRFACDFSAVRLHTHSPAAAASRAIGARAFTMGADIAFARGEFAPSTPSGDWLIAHELSHVAQQRGSDRNLIQRAEVDDRPHVCAPLTDIESDVNALVRREIGAARTATGIRTGASARMPSRRTVGRMLRGVAARLGSLTDPISAIERFIEALPAAKRFLPTADLVGTRFEGAASVDRFYLLHTLGAANVVGSTAKVHGICVGADKLGHFFQQGFDYAAQISSGSTVAAAESTGRFGEIGNFGLTTTGVFSNADLAANRSGLGFYNDLALAPTTFTFDIASYISSTWNEQSNPSFYSSSLAGVIWRNVLTGTWSGTFDTGSGTTAEAITSVLTVSSSGGVAGSYSFGAPAVTGAIRNGTINQITTAVSGVRDGSIRSDTPVSGITVSFDWSQGSLSGKGQWASVRENRLDGTWGTGTSRSNGGRWQMDKV